MSKPIIRYLRLHCPTPTSTPQPNRDGVLAVASINEQAQLAQMLLGDMRRWGRNDGASVRDALGLLVPAAHRHLVAGFGISLADTLFVGWDGGETFLRLRVEEAPARWPCERAPACAMRIGAEGGRSCFLAWTGPVGASMLEKAEAVLGGMWAGVEG